MLATRSHPCFPLHGATVYVSPALTNHDRMTRSPLGANRPSPRGYRPLASARRRRGLAKPRSRLSGATPAARHPPPAKSSAHLGATAALHKQPAAQIHMTGSRGPFPRCNGTRRMARRHRSATRREMRTEEKSRPPCPYPVWGPAAPDPATRTHISRTVHCTLYIPHTHPPSHSSRTTYTAHVSRSRDVPKRAVSRREKALTENRKCKKIK